MIKRLIVLLVLSCILSSMIFAQAVQPRRGAYSPETPYGVPDGLQIRDLVYVVNTTSDADYNSGNICDPYTGAGLTLREAIEDCEGSGAATIYVPAGVYYIKDTLNLNATYTNVTIIGEDPFTTIIDNTRDDVTRADGHGFSFNLGAGQSATIANLTLRDSDANLSDTDPNGGGLFVTASGGSLTLHNLILESNSGSQGGAIAVEGELNLTGTNLTFTNNAATAGSGGALRFLGTASDEVVSISDSIFIGNTATASGGAIFIWGVDNALFSNVTIMKNEAGDSGGGIYLDYAHSSFVNTEITLNTADRAGGLSTADNVYAYNTVIEDNTDTYGTPDCYIDVERLWSQGNNAIGNLFLCDVELHPTDMYNNLLENGGFEQAGARIKTPGGWTVTAPGAARVCEKPGKAASGVCALKLTPGAKVQQSVDLTGLTFSESDMLQLFAEGHGMESSNASVKVIVTYGDGTPKDSRKITFNGIGATPGFDPADDLIVLTSANVSKIVAKIANTAGTLYLDRVYLFVELSGAPRGVLPVPAAPATLRGSN